MNLRIIPLASSSKANSTAVVAGEKVFVVDAGLKRAEILPQLFELGVLSKEKPKPDGLLLSHEHIDHARYHGEWWRVGTPIYMTPGTALALKFNSHSFWTQCFPWKPREIEGGIVLTPIQVPHDASEPVAWRIAYGGSAVIVATDLGGFPVGWNLFVQNAKEILLEANYHPTLLEQCDYALPVKRRIGGAKGHLSVLDCADWIRDSLPATVTHLYLGHISRKACDPLIVRHLAQVALGDRPVELTVVER